MKKLTFTVFATGILMFMSLGLNAQVARQATIQESSQDNFFTKHTEFTFRGTSIAGNEDGQVQSVKVEGDKIILDVFIEGKPNPNYPPHFQPKDRNEERIIFYENGNYYVTGWEGDRIKGELRTYDDQIILSFNFGDAAIEYVVDKTDHLEQRRR